MQALHFARLFVSLHFKCEKYSKASHGKVKKMIRSVNTIELKDYIKTLLDYNQRTLRPQLIAYANDHAIDIF